MKYEMNIRLNLTNMEKHDKLKNFEKNNPDL